MTSKLEKYLSHELYTRFGQYSIRQNYRPDWLEGLELDFYIDEIKLAAEVQGQQHYVFTPHFHKSIDDFNSQKERDERKKYICKLHGIKLVEIFTEKDADLFISLVREKQNTNKIELPTEIKIKSKNSKVVKGRIKGYNECVRKLFLYENGLMEAKEEHVKMWRNVVSKGLKVNGKRLA